MLMRSGAAKIVLNTAELTLLTPRGGTPLVNLCATLSNAGYSVAVVGHEDQTVINKAAVDVLKPCRRPDLALTTST